MIKHFRAGTDDENWIIPELINQDIFRMKEIVDFVKWHNGVAIDCGAHIGCFTVKLIESGFDREVVAFEPQPDNFELLLKNTVDYPKVRPVNAAVSWDNSIKKLRLFNLGETGRWSAAPTLSREAKMFDPTKYIDADVINLAGLIRRLDGDISVLKLDLEGFEVEIINSLLVRDLQKIKVLVLEEHEKQVRHDLLIQSGFHLWFRPMNSHRQFVYRR
jgi:FkbM family methyltransferase